MILNIEAWQKPISIIESEMVQVIAPSHYETVIKPYKGWTAPEFRNGNFIVFYSENGSTLEKRLLDLEKLKKTYISPLTKPIDKLGIISEYRDIAETYNLLVGFNCMETEITKLNLPLTNNSGKIVVNFG